MIEEKVEIVPLSVNKVWQGRRFKTKTYKDYEKYLLSILPKYDTPVGELHIELEYGFSSKLSDIDNPCKPLLDVLCKKYGFDDRQIVVLNQVKKIVKKGKEYLKFKINEL